MKKISKEFKEKTINELEKEKQLIAEELAKLKLLIKINPPKDTNVLVKKKKRLAIILTLLTEKKETDNKKS